MNLEFAMSSRVVFGKGEFGRVGSLAESLGSRILVMTGRESARREGILDRLESIIRPLALRFEYLEVAGEPTMELIEGLLAEAGKYAPEVIVAIGGGSVIDAAKAVSFLLTNEGDLIDYLEGVDGGKPILTKPIPVIAVPTTTGSGSEVTSNAVIRGTIEGKPFKRSLRGPLLRPEIALIDPVLSMSMSSEVAAWTGMDAQAQLLEAFTSRRSGILTDGFAREGLGLVATALEQAYFNPKDQEAREAMAMAALLGGMALDNAGLGAVHGLASAIGALFDIPHGVICANLLPEITNANIRLAGEAEGHDRLLDKYREFARIASGKIDDDVQRLITTLKLQRRTLKIPPLDSFGVTHEHIGEILALCRTGSMATNPVYLSDTVLRSILTKLIKPRT